jgi:RelB Antitoxin alpha helical domain
MLQIHKTYVVDENQVPLAIQIPIVEFEKIEEILENFGLTQLIAEVADEEHLSGEEAKKYYQSLKSDYVRS